MSLPPFPGFHSFPTHHCVTGSIRHIYAFHDYPISEDMLLGLGSGVGFLYWHMKGAPPFLGGRANVERPGVEGLEKTIGRRTGVTVESHRTNSPAKAESALLELLAAGEPVMLVLDMGFLPYFDFGGQDDHFGAHAVVACGYDPETRQVLLADRDESLHPVSWETLAKARRSKFKPFPPQHQWYTFDFSGKHPPQPGEIRQAIREVVDGMLTPPIANFGVKGIHTAASRILEWPNIMGSDDLRLTCLNAFIFTDATGGTGGGLFRYMYGSFLGEAAALTGETRLAEVGEQMRAIGDQWQEAALHFREASTGANPNPSLSAASSALTAIAGRELSAWEDLSLLAWAI